MKKTIVIILLSLMTSIAFANSHYPVRGTSMDGVISKVGEPDKKMSAVGDPPITRWVYANFTVYFEDQTVIHSVSNKKK